jgi:hypothetical protein
VFVRVIAAPPGEAPEAVRRAWVGLELPLAAGETGPRVVHAGGAFARLRAALARALDRVESAWEKRRRPSPQARALLARVRARLEGRTRTEFGFVIDAPRALLRLADKAPWAAQWWRERAPHTWKAGHTFVFPADVCADVSAELAGPPVPRARAPAEAVTSQPASRASNIQIEKPPAADLRGSGPAAAPADCRSLGIGEALGWTLSVTAVLFAIADLTTGWYGMTAVRAVALAFGTLVAVACRHGLRQLDREALSPRRWPEPDPSAGEPFRLPAGAAAVVELARPAAPTFTLETRAGTCSVEPTLAPTDGLWPAPDARAVRRSPDCLEVVPGPSACGLTMLGVVMASAAWIVTFILEADAHNGGGWFDQAALFAAMQFGAVIGGMFALSPFLGRRFRVDRGAGEVRVASLFENRVVCRVADVLAVQAVRGAGTAYQVNLVLGDQDPDRGRVNVVCHGKDDAPKGRNALRVARTLAVFLEAPLVDQLEAMAVLGPAEAAAALQQAGGAGTTKRNSGDISGPH